MMMMKFVMMMMMMMMMMIMIMVGIVTMMVAEQIGASKAESSRWCNFTKLKLSTTTGIIISFFCCNKLL